MSWYYTLHNKDSRRTKIRFELTKYTPYLALTGEHLGENRPRYNGTALYFQNGCYWIDHFYMVGFVKVKGCLSLWRLLQFDRQIKDPHFFIKAVKTGSGGVCRYNARGRVRTGSMFVLFTHKSKGIATTKPERSALSTIITWHFWFGILHLKCKYGARNESPFACFSQCHVAWC